MSKSAKKIISALLAIANDYASSKKLGYEFARLIIDAEKNATEVAPIINVKMAEVTVPLEYGLFELGTISHLLDTTTVYDDNSLQLFNYFRSRLPRNRHRYRNAHSTR